MKMNLRAFLSDLDPAERADFAERCNTSKGHLQNVMYGIRPCSPGLAVLIEQLSEGRVTRKELRPDWMAIWPELATE